LRCAFDVDTASELPSPEEAEDILRFENSILALNTVYGSQSRKEKSKKTNEKHPYAIHPVDAAVLAAKFDVPVGILADILMHDALELDKRGICEAINTFPSQTELFGDSKDRRSTIGFFGKEKNLVVAALLSKDLEKKKNGK